MHFLYRPSAYHACFLRGRSSVAIPGKAGDQTQRPRSALPPAAGARPASAPAGHKRGMAKVKNVPGMEKVRPRGRAQGCLQRGLPAERDTCLGMRFQNVALIYVWLLSMQQAGKSHNAGPVICSGRPPPPPSFDLLLEPFLFRALAHLNPPSLSCLTLAALSRPVAVGPDPVHAGVRGQAGRGRRWGG